MMAMAKNAAIPIPASAPVERPVEPGAGVGDAGWETTPMGGNVGPGVISGVIGSRVLDDEGARGVGTVRVVGVVGGIMNPLPLELPIAVNVVMPVV